jgi:hypothetical protein
MAIRSRRYDGAVFAPATTVFIVTTETNQLVLETDDWVDAQAAALYKPGDRGLRHVRGVHPSHVWDSDRSTQLTYFAGNCRRCTKCGGWDNGSYGSQAPCGYDWRGGSLVAAVERELALRVAASILARGVTHIGAVDLEEISGLLTPEES